MKRCVSQQVLGHVAPSLMSPDEAAWVREHVIRNFYADYEGETNQTLAGPSDFYTRDEAAYVDGVSNLCYCHHPLCALVGTRRRRDRDRPWPPEGHRLRHVVWLAHAVDPLRGAERAFSEEKTTERSHREPKRAEPSQRPAPPASQPVPVEAEYEPVQLGFDFAEVAERTRTVIALAARTYPKCLNGTV